MHIVVAPDSFKSTLSAAEVCDIVASAAFEVLPGVRVTQLPLADGGEGSIDAMLAGAGGRKVGHRVLGPDFGEVPSFYGRLDGDVAVIELAAICGLMMMKPQNPEVSTTFGVGQMMARALDDGCRKLILCVGGSATNDAGIGALAALGVDFLDSAGRMLPPNGASLSQLASVDASRLDPRLREVDLSVACDVDNPLYGETGAAYVFAPQKGADAPMVRRLDIGLRHYAEILKACAQKDVASIPGVGAAGGVAASLIAFCAAQLSPGIDLFLDVADFDRRIRDADLIVTGEGKTDAQTLRGKAVLGVARRARAQGVPVLVVSGSVEDGVDEALYREGVRAVFSASRMARPLSEVRDQCPEWLRRTAENVFRSYFHV